MFGLFFVHPVACRFYTAGRWLYLIVGSIGGIAKGGIRDEGERRCDAWKRLMLFGSIF